VKRSSYLRTLYQVQPFLVVELGEDDRWRFELKGEEMTRPWLVLRHCARIRLEWQRKTMSIFSYSSHYPDRDLNHIFPENTSEALTPEPFCPAINVGSVQYMQLVVQLRIQT
jgi:hypothetical protein